MRTARLLPVSLQEGVPAGGVPPWGVPAQGCTCSGGVYLPGGVPAQGDVPAQGVYLPWEVYLPGGRGWYLPRYSPLRTEFLTHATENITLPQLRCG